MAQLRDLEAMMILGKNVRKYREEQGMTMQALANQAGLEYSQIARVERGKINTSVSVIFAIAKALETEPSKLLENGTRY